MNKPFVLAVLGWILVAIQSVEAQQPAKMRKIGFLNPTGSAAANIDVFRQGLRGLGYIEGKNVIIDYRNGDSREQLTAARN